MPPSLSRSQGRRQKIETFVLMLKRGETIHPQEEGLVEALASLRAGHGVDHEQVRNRVLERFQP